MIVRAAAPSLSFDVLPDGNMIVVAAGERRLLRHQGDGKLLRHARSFTLPANGLERNSS